MHPAVSRIKCRSDLYEMDMILDVNVDVYPVDVGQKLSIMLASTLNLDGTPSPTTFDGVRQHAFMPLLNPAPTSVTHNLLVLVWDPGLVLPVSPHPSACLPCWPSLCCRA